MSQITPNDLVRSDNVNDQQTLLQMPGEKAAQALATGIQAVAGGPRLEVGPVPLSRVAEYELLKEIGRGGMGVVFKARHVRLNRIVALKMIRGGTLANSDERQRFEKEAAAAAQLQHPNIVALYEVSNYDQQPFLSMEYIGGTSLAERLALGPLSGRRAAEYLELTARAVHYAHTRGIVHRDLKPANVLLDEHDQPKVTDFGLAKHMETQSDQTRTGAILGTPSYMSPEQANGSKQITPASDVYSLGAILYELITGKAPFCGETPLATLNLVVEQDPIPPRVLTPTVDRDLETICLKCLEKSPERRYASAESLADDLRRYLAGDAIAARRVGPIDRAMKWVRRNPAWTTLAGFLVVAIAGIIGFSWYKAYTESELREQAEAAKVRAEQAQTLAATRLQEVGQLLYLAEMREAQQTLRRADLDGTLRILNGHRHPKEGQKDLRDWEWFFLKERAQTRLAFGSHPAAVSAVAYHPDAKILASAGGADIKIWDVATGRLLRTLRGHTKAITSLAFQPDQLAERPDDKPTARPVLASSSHDDTIRVWNFETGTPIATLQGHTDSVNQVAFSPNGARLASASHDRRVCVWNATHWRKELDHEIRHDRPVTSLAFHPDGERIAFAGGAANRPGVIKLWNPTKDLIERTFHGHEDVALSLAFSADGKMLISGGGHFDRGEVLLWHVANGKLHTAHHALSARVLRVVPSRQGQFAAAGTDGILRIWSHMDASQALSLRADPQSVNAVAFAPDGHSLATGGEMGRVSLWNSSAGVESLTLPTVGMMETVAFHPRDGFLAAGGARGEVRVWDLDHASRPIEVKGHTSGVFALAFAPDGKRLASGGADRMVRIVDFLRPELPAVLLEGHNDRVYAIAYHPDGQLIATAGEDEVIRLWDPADGKLLRVLKGHANIIHCLAFSPDGAWLASGGIGAVRLWDVKTGELAAALQGHTGTVNAIAFSPKGDDRADPLLVSASSDKTIRVWNLAKREEAYHLVGAPGKVQAIAFHPGGRRLVSLGQDRLIRLWDIGTRQEILEFEEHLGHLRAVAFSPDGRSLASAGAGGVRVWQASKEMLTERK